MRLFLSPLAPVLCFHRGQDDGRLPRNQQVHNENKASACGSMSESMSVNPTCSTLPVVRFDFRRYTLFTAARHGALPMTR